MRNSIVGSGVIHGLLLVALFYVRTPVALVIPGPQAVQVALMDPAAMVAPAPAPQVEPPPPEPKPVEVKPVEDTGVKLAPEPPKKKKKKPEKPREDEPPPRPAATLPSATVGSAGLKGDVSVDAQNFEFTYYLVAVRNRIAANWTPPAGLATGGRRVRAVVYFRIGRDGGISGVNMESTSALEFFDRSALRAVTISDPLPPLPFGFGGGELGVHFGFEWETP